MTSIAATLATLLAMVAQSSATSGGAPSPTPSTQQPTSQAPTSQSPTITPTAPAATNSVPVKAADKLKYDAHVAAAKAYVDAGEKASAIECYEKALLAAPDDASRRIVIEELRSLSTVTDDFLSPPLELLQEQGVWIVLAVLAVLAVLVRHAWIRWISQRIVVGPPGNEFAGYFRDLVRHAQHSVERQRDFAARINRLINATASPMVQSRIMLAENIDLPTNIVGQWWSPFASSLLNGPCPRDYSVVVRIMSGESTCGLTVGLFHRRKVVHHWQRSCGDSELPASSADLAFEVVAAIGRLRETNGT